MKKSKTAIVTGGSRGIGLTIAKILAKKKYNIVICARNSKPALKAKKEIESYGVKCLVYKVDVSNYNQCKSFVKNTIKKFSRIDVLVNNAGYQGAVKKLWQSNIKDWERTIDINLSGAFYMMHIVTPYMLKQKGGAIINLSGGGSAYARPNFCAYGTSKAALLRLTETLSEELKGTKVFVYAIGPGAVWTKMAKDILSNKSNDLNAKALQELREIRKTGGTPFKKLEDLIGFLVSNKASKLSGKLVHVNELSSIVRKMPKIKPESGLLRRTNYK